MVTFCSPSHFAALARSVTVPDAAGACAAVEPRVLEWLAAMARATDKLQSDSESADDEAYGTVLLFLPKICEKSHAFNAHFLLFLYFFCGFFAGLRRRSRPMSGDWPTSPKDSNWCVYSGRFRVISRMSCCFRNRISTFLCASFCVCFRSSFNVFCDCLHRFVRVLTGAAVRAERRGHTAAQVQGMGPVRQGWLRYRVSGCRFARDAMRMRTVEEKKKHNGRFFRAVTKRKRAAPNCTWPSK